MLLVPKRNSSLDLFEEFFKDDFFTKKSQSLMKSDIKETDNNYVIETDLPGYSKENITIDLKNGYLEISAKVESIDESKDKEKYIHKERFYGECSRNFYVGEDIKEEDISAEFKNGILKITIPKKEEQEKIEEIKHIEIK